MDTISTPDVEVREAREYGAHARSITYLGETTIYLIKVLIDNLGDFK